MRQGCMRRRDLTCQCWLSCSVQHAVAAPLRWLNPSQDSVAQRVEHIGTGLALVLLAEDVGA